MKKLLSYSLFQTDPKEKSYITCMFANKEVIEELYPEWTVRVYIGDTVDHRVFELFRRWKYEVIIMPDSGYGGAFWRFLPFWDKSVDIWVSMDADEMCTYSFRDTIQEWEHHSDRGFMRLDYEYEGTPWVPAPLFGVKRKCNEVIQSSIRVDRIAELCKHNCYYAHDERWLVNEIMPLVNSDCFLFRFDNVLSGYYKHGENQWAKEGIFYSKRVVPPVDSILVRHHLMMQLCRNTGENYDIFTPYYNDDQLIRIEPFEHVIAKMHENGLKTRIACPQR